MSICLFAMHSASVIATITKLSMMLSKAPMKVKTGFGVGGSKGFLKTEDTLFLHLSDTLESFLILRLFISYCYLFASSVGIELETEHTFIDLLAIFFSKYI